MDIFENVFRRLLEVSKKPTATAKKPSSKAKVPAKKAPASKASKSDAASELAAYCIDDGDAKMAVLYSPSKFFEVAAKDESLDFISCVKAAVVGYVQIDQPDSTNPCAGAWEVTRTAGPGYGSLVYGLAYALSPTGRLMSDREKVSPAAYPGWEKAYATSKKTQLTKKDPRGIKKSNTDCTLHSQSDTDCYRSKRDPEPLNYAYESNKKIPLDQLMKSHENFIKKIIKDEEFDVSVDNIKDVLYKCGGEFFNLHSRDSYR